ncbi:DUF3078 domain-containing protein [Psychroserpens sp. SPM9]|uniref:DUF3078 domain-containing protein n=1 Tax=Psychroserpens sp. SPM9 TaxID=2975598 RepID=UPI0021A67F2C|nr:DUF3078 domain-containing protein [Psychroserpens sp. SPM9]MDG5492580.1 DUF3078 domain-containing protein [Psychroserpens sp. SPM9]
MRLAFFTIALVCFQLTYAQTDAVQTEESDYTWFQTNKMGIDISEVTFVNWNAGGSNSISALLNVVTALKYEDSYFKWKNSALLRYGINKQEGQKIRKTEDQLELISTLGFRQDTLTNWYFSGRFNFKTQLTDGFNYPDRTNEISKFMAPGYLFFGGGAEYGKNLEKFSLYFSPLTVKATFVLDEDLSNSGSFGVEPAVFDENGVLIEQGERVRTEMGILLTNALEVDIYENISMKNQLSLYTDYLNNLGNTDIDWEIVFNFTVNEYVKATLGSHVRYDDDIKILEPTEVEGEFAESGARVQWKQLLGVGVVIDF